MVIRTNILIMTVLHPEAFGNGSKRNKFKLFVKAAGTNICSNHGIKLQDHVIVSKNGYYSYHLAGKMQEISAKYSRKNLFEK